MISLTTKSVTIEKSGGSETPKDSKRSQKIPAGLGSYEYKLYVSYVRLPPTTTTTTTIIINKAPSPSPSTTTWQAATPRM
jgi:hypothetical protein